MLERYSHIRLNAKNAALIGLTMLRRLRRDPGEITGNDPWFRFESSSKSTPESFRAAPTEFAHVSLMPPIVPQSRWAACLGETLVGIVPFGKSSITDVRSPGIMPPITWLYSQVRRSGRTRYSLSSALEGWARCIALAIYA